jgi:hypothetical protein
MKDYNFRYIGSVTRSRQKATVTNHCGAKYLCLSWPIEAVPFDVDQGHSCYSINGSCKVLCLVAVIFIDADETTLTISTKGNQLRCLQFHRIPFVYQWFYVVLCCIIAITIVNVLLFVCLLIMLSLLRLLLLWPPKNYFLLLIITVLLIFHSVVLLVTVNN